MNVTDGIGQTLCSCGHYFLNLNKNWLTVPC